MPGRRRSPRRGSSSKMHPARGDAPKDAQIEIGIGHVLPAQKDDHIAGVEALLRERCGERRLARAAFAEDDEPVAVIAFDEAREGLVDLRSPPHEPFDETSGSAEPFERHRRDARTGSSEIRDRDAVGRDDRRRCDALIEHGGERRSALRTFDAFARLRHVDDRASSGTRHRAEARRPRRAFWRRSAKA